MCFSEELKAAMEYGYCVEPLWGIKFKRGVGGFDKYVHQFFKIKLDSELNPFMRKTVKFLLNGLHGRFGIRNVETNLKYVSKEQADHLDTIYNLTEKTSVEINGCELFYVRYKTRNHDFLLDKR